jgi:hypothetical protein
MRRKRKLIYYIQNISKKCKCCWWYKRKWRKIEDCNGATNMAKARTFDLAMKIAKKLKILGGDQLISRRYLSNNKWQNFKL